MTGKFVFIASFKVDEAISTEFQNWMENVHFPDMHKTGCFVGPIKKVLDTKDHEGCHIITYTHKLTANEAGWDKYRSDYRPKLREEFFAKFSEALKSNKIGTNLTAGYEEEFFK